MIFSWLRIWWYSRGLWEDKTRSSAEDKLVKIGRPSVRKLLRLLRSNNFHVRASAARVLGKIGDKGGLDGLVEMLNDQSLSSAPGEAVEALVRIGDKQVVPHLVAVLNKEKSRRFRDKLIIALGMLQDARAVEPLVPFLKDESSFIRDQAAKALGSIGDVRAVKYLEEALSLYTNKPIAESLERLGWQPSNSRLRALQAIAFERPEDAAREGNDVVESLIPLLKSDYQIVRECAAKALGILATPGDSSQSCKRSTCTAY